MRIRGVENLTLTELEAQLAAGGRFVLYEYCISLVVVTLRRPSDVYFVRAWPYAIWRGLPFTLISLLLGWWGLPWGFVYTPLILLTNLTGGRDVTGEVWQALRGNPSPDVSFTNP